MSDHWQTIEDALEFWRSGEMFDEERMHIDAALAFVREQRAAQMGEQVVEAIDTLQGFILDTGPSLAVGMGDDYVTVGDDITKAARIVNQWLNEQRRVPTAPQAATQQVQPLDAPDGPGWWAFKGYQQFSNGDQSPVIQDMIHVFDTADGFYGYGTDHTVYRRIQDGVFVGKWYRLTMPWDVDTLTQRPQPTDAKGG